MYNLQHVTIELPDKQKNTTHRGHFRNLMEGKCQQKHAETANSNIPTKDGSWIMFKRTILSKK